MQPDQQQPNYGPQPVQPPPQPVQQSPASPAPTPQGQQPSPPPQSKSLSIVGLVLAVFLPIVGLIVSIVAFSKAKRSGQNTSLAIAGIVVGIIMTLVFAGVAWALLGSTSSGIQDVAKDNERTVDVKYLGTSIESYVNSQGVFPSSLSDLSQLTDFDGEALIEPDAGSYGYELTPEGCDPQINCTGYRVFTTSSTGETIQESNSIAQ